METHIRQYLVLRKENEANVIWGLLATYVFNDIGKCVRIHLEKRFQCLEMSECYTSVSSKRPPPPDLPASYNGCHQALARRHDLRITYEIIKSQ